MEPSTKRRHTTEIDEFDDDDHDDQPDSDEISSYQRSNAGQHSILQWWKLHEADFPGLAIIARRTLGIMPTSAASERNFSLAGHVVDERRSSLRSDSVNNILLLNSALRN